nr:hypothetical protein [Burkholderiales bacterium]
MKTFYQNMENDLKELLEQRQKICEMICANPFFGSDYTNRFIWEVKNHSYKNLGNYLLWCEYLLKIIKTSNELEQRRPSFHSVKILASNQELYNEIQKA